MKMFLPLLCLLFIALKLTDQIDWSWWVVLMPFYVHFFPLIFGVFLICVGALLKSIDSLLERGRNR